MLFATINSFLIAMDNEKGKEKINPAPLEPTARQNPIPPLSPASTSQQRVRPSPQIQEALVKAKLLDCLIQKMGALGQLHIAYAYKGAIEHERERSPYDKTLEGIYQRCCELCIQLNERKKQNSELRWPAWVLIHRLSQLSEDEVELEITSHIKQYLNEYHPLSTLQPNPDPISESLLPFLKPREPRKERPTGLAGIIGGVDQAILDLAGMLSGELDYKKFDVPFPKGILFAGLPGTGKTALARAIGEEIECYFSGISASDFNRPFMGHGSQYLREVYAKARAKAKITIPGKPGRAIIFIDELDSIGKRINISSSGDAEINNIVNTLLTEMDGIQEDNSIITIAATNNPQALDPALLRPGRFGLTIEIPLPDLKKRIALLEFFNQSRPVHIEVNYETIAKALAGGNVADVKNVTDLAAQNAMRIKSDCIRATHFEQALQAFYTSETNKKKNFLHNNVSKQNSHKQ